MLSTIECKALLKRIGENVETFRLIKKKSVKEIASSLNLSTSAYRNIERGISEVSILKIVQIASLLNIDPAQLIDTQTDTEKNENVLLDSNTKEKKYGIKNQSLDSKNELPFSKKNLQFLKDILDRIKEFSKEA